MHVRTDQIADVNSKNISVMQNTVIQTEAIIQDLTKDLKEIVAQPQHAAKIANQALKNIDDFRTGKYLSLQNMQGNVVTGDMRPDA